MNEIRSVSVRLDADVAGYIAKMKLAGAETDRAFSSSGRSIDSTNTKLTTTERTLGKVDTQARKVDTSVSGMGRTFDSGGRSIDKYSGRLGLLVSGLTAIGPAAVPLTAVAIPAVTALASGLGFAAIGAGTFALAFHGVKDALTAVNKAALEPTDANLQAAHLAMSQLPPDARAFVRELQHLRPEILRLQTAAGSGLFPGLTDGLRSLRTDGPLAERAVHNIGAELGDLARDAGRSLSSDQWRPFLRFVGTEGPREIGILGHAVGSVTHGLAELWMAMSPLNRGVDAGIDRLADGFDRWATNLDKTKDFQSFVQYVQTNGPHVVELLGDTADLFVDIVKAAAPLGGPTIQALDLIVKVLDAIANSPLGTPLLLLAQIASVLKLTSRGLGALGVDAKIGLGGVTSSSRQGSASLRALRADAVSAGSALRTIGGNVGRNAAPFGSPLTAGVNKEGLNNLAKGAALAGGFAFAMSGLDQQMGLTNTTSLALAGSLGGPVGIGVGAAAGSLLDLQAQIEKDRKSMEDFNAEVQQLASKGNAPALQKLSDQLHGFQDQTGGLAGDLAGKLLADVDPALAKTKAKLDDLSGSQKLAAQAAGKFGHAQQVAAQQTLAMRSAARTTAGQFLTLGQDVDNTKVSLDKWIHQLGSQARALENFGTNAKTAADKGLRDGLIKQLELAGPAGALRMRQLANATQSEIGKANRAWGSGKKAADDYQEAVAYIANHPPNLSVNGVPESIHQLRLVEEAMRRIHDRVVSVTVQRHTGGQVLPGDAAGGTIPGPRWPYGDKVLRRLAPGEEVISNSHGQADMNRGALKAANRGARLAVIGGMAGGGTVERFHQVSTSLTSTSSSRTVERIVERLPRSMRLAVQGGDLVALIDGRAAGVYGDIQDWEGAQNGG